MRRREFITLLGGAAVVWPFAARAQGKRPLVGYLAGAEPAAVMRSSTSLGFRNGLRDQGFVEGRDIDLAYRFADGFLERLPTLAKELAALKPEQAEAEKAPPPRRAGTAAPAVAAAPKLIFQIHVPTNAELAANLKGHLLLVHGEVDNNVHPANTMRLVDALIKANKRFDMLILPGQRHGFGEYTTYFQKRMEEFFAEALLGDRREGADMDEK